MNVKGKRIFVGLSGGVDSAVTAALLKEQGANVTGVFVKGWYPPGMPCTWAEDRRDAMRVAARLQIPFHTLDASKEYKQGVIDYLLAEYRAGRTPNPDVMCNREVKFGAFYRFAMAHGADAIATGHYAIQEDGTLLRGLDASKDQSYFLWAVAPEALSHTLFPLGRLKKGETRERARRYQLPNAARKDSQGICFLGSISVEDFLRSEFGAAPGAAITTDGSVVGEHDGALLYTLGERVALKSAAPGPWYVLAKDVEANTLTVGKERGEAGTANAIGLTHENWLGPVPTEALEAQYRYHGPKIEGTYDATRNEFVPAAPLAEAIAPGQSLVLYEGARVVGGGIIR